MRKKPLSEQITCYSLQGSLSPPVGDDPYLFQNNKWREREKMTSYNSNPKSNPSEAHEQKQLIQWCRTDPRFQYLFHVPNESVGGPGWLTRNRQMGVKAGVPDLIYPVPMQGYHGLFIEMKTKTGRLSAEQKKWITALETFGYKVVVAHGWEQAKEALQDYVSRRTENNQ